jgi:hypothetical protein
MYRENVHAYSDVDIAVWSAAFTGDYEEDFEKVRPVYRRFKGVDIKTYRVGATADNTDPLIEVIESTGIVFLPGNRGDRQTEMQTGT